MVVQIEFPELEVPARILLGTAGSGFSAQDYWDFCAANPDLRTELNAQGEIVIVPPAGGESSYRSSSVSGQLGEWARRDGRGKVFDSSAGFVLPNGAVYAPDAAWVANAKLQTLSKDQRRKFLPVVPEFVVEVMSPSDRLPAGRAKAQEWLDAGSELVWLIDADHRTVFIYRPNVAPSTWAFSELAGEGAVEGFVLQLDEIWEGL